MNLVIPCSKFDIETLPQLAQVFIKFGPYTGSKLVVCPTEGAEHAANEFRNSLIHHFDSVDVVPTPTGVTGWPRSPNIQARIIFGIMEQRYGNAPFYYFEPDNTPIRYGWLNVIKDAYRSANAPYMGVIRPTRVVRRNRLGDIERGFEGKHMVGTGIYPPNAFSRSVVIHAIDRQMVWAQREPTLPWDIRCRDEIVPRAAHTDLIDHKWSTVNYRVEGDKIVCDPNPKNPEGTDHSGEVLETAVVVHGCKDGSLADLVLADLIPGEAKAGSITPPVHITAPVVNTMPFFQREEPRTSDRTLPTVERKAQPVLPPKPKVVPLPPVVGTNAPILPAPEPKPYIPPPPDGRIGMVSIDGPVMDLSTGKMVAALPPPPPPPEPVVQHKPYIPPQPAEEPKPKPPAEPKAEPKPKPEPQATKSKKPELTFAQHQIKKFIDTQLRAKQPVTIQRVSNETELPLGVIKDFVKNKENGYRVGGRGSIQAITQ